MIKPSPVLPATRADLFTDPQASAYLGGIPPRTLRLWRRNRGLPYIKITSKVIRHRKTDLDAWLDQHRVAVMSGIENTDIVDR